jgi:hypothetical protein
MSLSPAQKAKVKTAKDALRSPLKDVLTAEAVLRDAQIAAAPAITSLIKAAGDDPGPHKIRIGDNAGLYTFRKAGEYLGDANGNPVTVGSDGKLPEGAKNLPYYNTKITDLSEDD